MKAPNSYFQFFIISHLLLGFALLCWFTPHLQPFCLKLDRACFQLLNHTLHHKTSWQLVWGLLNHRVETTYNLLIAVLMNVWALLQTKGTALQQKRIKQLIYFWIFFQIGFSVQDYFFHTYLQIERLSPSLVVHSTFRLSTALKNPNIKDASLHCFPSGHAFALIYWASFSFLCASRRIALFGLCCAIFLCLPRLFSGAHWLSDTLFSALLAQCWLSWTLICPLYHIIIKNFKK